MKTFKIILIVMLALFLIKILILPPANTNVNQKLSLIKNEISKRGYSNNWFVISGRRQKWYNKVLPNSAKESYHLKGEAIDIYVIDINGDGKFNSEDIKIFESCNASVERTHPEFSGALGTYTTKGYFSRHMIHIDTRGYKKRYNM
jgi:hypothetical protein